MTLAQEIICPRCDHRFPLSRLLNLCTCGLPLLVHYDLKKASANFSISSLRGRVSSLWRYRELLPLRDDANLVSLGEGFTPLLPAKSLAGKLGLKRLWIKDEAQNPTGSYKDRGLSLAISRAKELGEKKAAIPSAGNAGGSLAAYAARARIEAHVFMPRDTPIANQIAVQQYGARLTLVDGLINDCGRIVKAFGEGSETAEPWQNAKTVASGLRVPQAVADFLMLRALRESNGTALSVSDEEIIAEIPRLGRAEGIFFCPEGAACAAA